MDPVPDTVSDPAERVTRVIRRLVIVCVVLAIVLGGLRWVSAVTGLNLFEFMQPSASDVLDGQTANAQRLAAIRTVDEWMDHDAVPGATVAGKQVYTYCDWGQNNPEVREGYRLRCEATGVLFSSWAGSFDDFARAVASQLDGPCSAESNERPGPRTPPWDLSLRRTTAPEV